MWLENYSNHDIVRHNPLSYTYSLEYSTSLLNHMLTLGIFIFARDNGLIDFLKNGGEIAFQKQIFHFAMLLLFECAVLAVDLPLE